MTDSRQAFADTAREYFEQQGETRGIRFDADSFRLVIGDGVEPTSFVSLDGALREYEGASATERQQVVPRRFWSSVRRSGAPTAQESLHFVYPRIKDRAWFSAVRRQAQVELGDDEELLTEVMMPFRELNAELGVHLAFELPTSVMEIGPERLQAWGLSFDAALARALENLDGRATQPFVRDASGLHVSPYRDGLDATRMLLPHRLAALPVKGRLVAMAPNHDTLLVCGEGDDEALEAMARLAETAILEPRAHLALAFSLEGRDWRPWLPARSHASWARFKVLELQTQASAYARQKDVLEQLHGRTGEEVAVGTLRAFRTPLGDLFTAAVWTDEQPQLLPRTDRIDFIRSTAGTQKRQRTWSTTFEVALKTVGHLMQATADVPQRYRVQGFPTDEQLEAMARAGKLS